MTSRDRLRGACAAILVQALLGWMLVAGLATRWTARSESESLSVFRVVPPAPSPPPVHPPAEHRRAPHRAGEASPPNRRSTATELVAPPPVLPPLLPPIVAATRADTGAQATSGAAPVAGPGNGAGGAGNGRGAGGAGDGDGGGGGGTPPRWRSGELRDSDYPRDAGEAGTSGRVGVQYLVAVNGRVTDCEITRSSGSPALDDTTCRLIMKRFRFDPSRDAQGRAVPAWLVETHEWVVETTPPR